MPRVPEPSPRRARKPAAGGGAGQRFGGRSGATGERRGRPTGGDAVRREDGEQVVRRATAGRRAQTEGRPDRTGDGVRGAGGAKQARTAGGAAPRRSGASAGRDREEREEGRPAGRRADRDARWSAQRTNGGGGRRAEGSGDDPRAPRTWGSLARKGTRQLREEGVGPASTAWREAVVRSRTPEGAADAPAAWEPERWVREDRPAPRRAGAKQGTARPRDPGDRRPAPSGRRAGPAEAAPAARGRKPRTLPSEVATELVDAVGGATRAARIQQRLTDATGAYERERYRDAARMLKPLSEQAPAAAAVRELYGLTLYRLGRWDAAVKELEAFRSLSDSLDQHPTLADCYRAKKRWRRVDELWEELRRASPGPELLAEGRLVKAGSLAERGRMGEAIELLERAKTEQRKPREHHLRTWYALADLYERAGEVPRARELFRRILAFDRDLFDTAERLASIG